MSDLILPPIPVRPCVKCGATDRNNSGDCKACAKARYSAWRAANPDKKKALNAAWSAANSDEEKARKAAWRAANADKEKDRLVAWYAANADKHKANVATWREANPDKVKTQNAVWRAANPDRAKAMKAAWRAENPDKETAAHAAWRAANPEAVRTYHRNRRALKKKAGGKLSSNLSAKLFKLQKGKCPCCKQSLGDDFHLDHVIPLARGGLNVDSNMQLLRAVCNMNKSAKDPLLFMQSRGFLL